MRDLTPSRRASANISHTDGVSGGGREVVVYGGGGLHHVVMGRMRGADMGLIFSVP